GWGAVPDPCGGGCEEPGAGEPPSSPPSRLGASSVGDSPAPGSEWGADGGGEPGGHPSPGGHPDSSPVPPVEGLPLSSEGLGLPGGRVGLSALPLSPGSRSNQLSSSRSWTTNFPTGSGAGSTTHPVAVSSTGPP